MIHGLLPPLACGRGATWPRVVPGTGALSPHPHSSPLLAALHLHLLAPSSMPSPRSQLPHMAHTPTATHHPSKSGSTHVSPVTQCNAPPHPSPTLLSPAQMPAWRAPCMESLFLSLPSPVTRAEDPSLVLNNVLNIVVRQYCYLFLFCYSPIIRNILNFFVFAQYNLNPFCSI